MSVVVLGAIPIWGQSEGDNIEALKSGSITQRTEAVKSICRARKNVITSLLPILAGDYPADAKRDVAKIMGEYRACEAIPLLIRNLELDLQPRIFKGLVKDADLYPISRALAEIGKPTIPALLTRITETDDSALIRCCVQICIEIEGREIAELEVNRRGEKESTEGGRQRLTRALEIMQKLQKQNKSN
jgi:hypothetical protein